MEEDQPTKFPRINVKTARKTINEKLMACVVQCLSEFKVSQNDVAGIIIHSANMVFDQDWYLSSEAESFDDDEDSSDDEEHIVDSAGPSKKRQGKSCRDLSNVFPSCRCIRMYLEDASYLNLKVVAEHLLNKDEKVITVGLDDTTKAGGHKLYDVKADHITVSGPRERTFLTTGYTENISHSGQDRAKAYEFKLNCLALLADSTLDEIKAAIDFWITDRAVDCKVLLENLGVDSEKNPEVLSAFDTCY